MDTIAIAIALARQAFWELSVCLEDQCLVPGEHNEIYECGETMAAQKRRGGERCYDSPVDSHWIWYKVAFCENAAMS